MKSASGFKLYSLYLIALLLASTVFLAGCFGDDSSNTTSTSNTQNTAITPIGMPTTCLKVDSPSLVKLHDGHYKLVDVINNCGGKDAGPLKITAEIDTQTTKHSTNLIGPPIIPANGKAMYQTYTGRSGSKDKEIDFLSPTSSPANIIILVTLNGTMQGEWDGQVTIPA